MPSAHSHAHDDQHGHHHAPGGFGGAFAIGAVLNTAFIIAQIVYGLAAHSTALLADAVHNAGDVLGLLLAWGAAGLARLRPTSGRTYGWGRGTILAALANAMILLLGCGAIAAEAVQRLLHPAPVAGVTMMWVAALGIIVNGVTALLFARGRHADLNLRGIFLHMASDAVVSAGVVVAGGLVLWLGWRWLDPVASLGIVAVITVGTWGLLRDSVNLAMDAVPEGIAPGEVEAALRCLPGVTEVHDLHIWGLSTTQTALTAHLVHSVPGDHAGLLLLACETVTKRFRIGHATFQIETPETAEGCMLRPAQII
jgi:cobalt-zinc-cadmium efflux system protein